jgi:hypothetical protein
MIPKGKHIVKLETGHPFLKFASEDVTRSVSLELDNFIVVQIKYDNDLSGKFTFYTIEQDTPVIRFVLICNTQGIISHSPYSEEAVNQRIRNRQAAEKFGI